MEEIVTKDEPFIRNEVLKDEAILTFKKMGEDGPFLIILVDTEPGGASDILNEDPKAGTRTTANLDGNEYVINGTKCFITNGAQAKLYILWAKTDITKGASQGLSTLLVPADTIGISIGKIEDKMGQRLSSQAEIIFEDVRVPKEKLLGREGDGIPICLDFLATGSIGVGALCVGLARAAYEIALDYSKQRVVLGQPIINHQAIGFMLADMRMKIEASRALVWKLAWENDNVERGNLTAMAKIYASDMVMSVTTDAFQVLGGYGYMKDYPLEKYMRDAKITQIYDVSNQILRLLVIDSLVRGK